MLHVMRVVETLFLSVTGIWMGIQLLETGKCGLPMAVKAFIGIDVFILFFLVGC